MFRTILPALLLAALLAAPPAAAGSSPPPPTGDATASVDLIPEVLPLLSGAASLQPGTGPGLAPWEAPPAPDPEATEGPWLREPPRPDLRPGHELTVRTVEGLSHSARGRAAGHVVVRFRDGLAGWQEEAVAAGLGAPRLARARHGDFARVGVPAGATPEEMVARFRNHPSVAWADVDPLFRAAYTEVVAAPAGAADVGSISDPLFRLQWVLQRIGLEEALSRNPRDGEGAVVAVIDSGVAYGDGAGFPARTAPDLEGVPILPGWDFVDDDPVPFDLGTTRGNPFENPRFGHGTFVASLIAATANNGVAGTGVAPRVALLPVRVLGIDGFGFGSQIADGIRFAVDNGADVINLSLGGTSRFEPGADAVRYALDRGVVVVAAAGNEADDAEVFEDELGSDVAWPARFPEVIAVGASDFDDRRATYSNFGPNLDLLAPAGDDAGREIPGQLRDAALATSFLHLPTTGETIYAAFWANGTSFASPQVAGAAALLVSLGVRDPEAVRAMLQLTARDLEGEGVDLPTGHGLLDAASAHRGLGFTN